MGARRQVCIETVQQQRQQPSHTAEAHIPSRESGCSSDCFERPSRSHGKAAVHPEFTISRVLTTPL